MSLKPHDPTDQRGGAATPLLLLFAVAVLTILVSWVLVTIFERKQEAREPFVRLAQVNELSTDPAPWGVNWPHQYDGYVATAGDKFRGGSSALPQSKLDSFPWLRRLYAGYAFALDYREARGHAYMLYDQGVTERVTKKPQAGACLHCHASTSVMYRQQGLRALGEPHDEAALAAGFDMRAVIRGFEEVSRKPYQEVLALVQAAPDGTPDGDTTFPNAPAGGFTGEYAGTALPDGHMSLGDAHPVSCIDCHDPKTMSIRVTRPGFVLGIGALAEGDAPVRHLPSIERWRRGDRERPYDPNRDATRQELRAYTCGQCHVEYYCGDKDVLTFPWGNGLRAEDLESFWDESTFPDGTPFYDYVHGETGAEVLKVQHPEFELWSQGIHARSGVTCADCHMPYERVGAMKLSSHDVASPLGRISRACGNCHHASDADMLARVDAIQSTTMNLMDTAAGALTEMLDAVLEAKAAGVSAEELAEIHAYQRKAMWRLDYISSENSRGFHAPQESARVLGESIEYSRRAQAAALRARAGAAPDTSAIEVQGVIGISDPAQAPGDRR